MLRVLKENIYYRYNTKQPPGLTEKYSLQAFNERDIKFFDTFVDYNSVAVDSGIEDGIFKRVTEKEMRLRLKLDKI